MTFHVLGTVFSDSHSKWYAPQQRRPESERGLPVEGELAVLLASLCIIQMRSPAWKLLGRTFVLYCLIARSLYAASRLFSLSRSSLIRSILIARLSWFRDR